MRASLAATFDCQEKEAGWMIDQLLRGPDGLASKTKHGTHFTFVVDSNAMRDIALELGREEVLGVALRNAPSSVSKPVLTSACPGWVSTLVKNICALIDDLMVGMLCGKDKSAYLASLIEGQVSVGLKWHAAQECAFGMLRHRSRTNIRSCSYAMLR